MTPQAVPLSSAPFVAFASPAPLPLAAPSQAPSLPPQINARRGPSMTMRPGDPSLTPAPMGAWNSTGLDSAPVPEFKFANPKDLDWSLLSDLFSS